MMTVAAWWPVVLCHCKCLIGREPTLLVLNAMRQVAVCPNCGAAVQATDIAKDEHGRLVVIVDVKEPKALGGN